MNSILTPTQIAQNHIKTVELNERLIGLWTSQLIIFTCRA